MKHVLFINLPTIPLSELNNILKKQNTVQHPLSMPLGILYLSSSLKQHNISKHSIIDFPYLLSTNSYTTVGDVLSESVENISYAPDIVAISLNFSASYKFFMLLIKRMKSKWPDAINIVGGIHASNCVKHILATCPEIDYVMKGEGEDAFVTFVKLHQSCLNIRGVYSRQSNLAIELDSTLPTSHLDSLPFPDLDLIDIDKYISARGRRRNVGTSTHQKMATIMTTRGCPNKCTFCSAHTVHGRKVRYRSIDNVISEILELNKKHGVTLFIPEDDLFTANRRRLLKMLEAIKSLEIPEIQFQFPNGLNTNTTTTEVVDALWNCGTRVFNFAIESGSMFTQEHLIRKMCKLDHAAEIISYTRNKGGLVRCYFIFGFPGETLSLMKESVTYMKSLNADWFVLGIAVPLIGSELYEQLTKRCVIKEYDEELWEHAMFQDRNFQLEDISPSALKQFVTETNYTLNFLENKNYVSGDYPRCIELFSDITSAYPHHIFALYMLYSSYVRIGDNENADTVRTNLLNVLETNPLSIQQFKSFSHLAPSMLEGPQPIPKRAAS